MRQRFLTLYLISGLFSTIFSSLLPITAPVYAQTPPAKQMPKKASLPPPVVEINLSTKRDVAPGPKVRLSINTRNLSSVTINLYKIDAVRWLRERDYRTEEDNKTAPPALPPGKPVRTFTVTVGDAKRRPSAEQPDIYFSKQFNLPELPPGVYRIVASGGGKETWSVANVTNLAVILKRAPRTVLAWVTDHRTGSPIVGAKVQLWNRKATQPTTQSLTNRDGICQFPAAPNSEQTLLVERMDRGRDCAALALGNTDPDGRLVSHVQTDRPVYRPGATVQYKAILRRTQRSGYLPEANVPITAEIRDGRDNVLLQTTLQTNTLGTLSGSFDIPAQGVLGAYSLVLAAPDKQQAYTTFSVAEYRKPDFKISVTPQAKRYLSGEKGGFIVQADYYFGTPLTQATVRYTVRRRPTPFFGGNFGGSDENDGWFASGDGNLYARDTYAAEEVVADGEIITDAKGRAVIPFATKTDLPDSEYSVTLTVTDGQRRQVEGGASVPVYAALLRLGIRARVYAVPLNGIVTVDLRLADLDSKPAAGRVTLVTRQRIWDKKTEQSVWRVLSRSTVNIPKTGKAVAKVPAAKAGSVEILATVTDAKGRIASAATDLWVTDTDVTFDTRSLPQEPTVTLRLDKKNYQPGETVQVYLNTNTPTRPTLLTVEGSDVFAYVIVPKGKPNFVWKVPATVGMSPNAFVTASQWARPAYSVFGNILLPVPDLSRHLAISITPDRTAYRPGDTALYTITAKDRLTGKPVPNTEIAIAVVDESIYAVRPDSTPEPFLHFWGQRQNQTDTRQSAPEEVSGGAYQRNNPDGVAPVREKFMDTAFWNAHLLTGPDGKAVAKVELPGNLTSWRATALGITTGTQVGRTTSNITVSRPVMLRLATPRQLVQGDILTLIGTLNNRTDRERAAEVTLKAEGISLADGETAAKSATIPANGETKVEWRIKAEAGDAAGVAHIEGTLIVTDRAVSEPLSDFSDRLRVRVPVRPRGSVERLLIGGPARESETTLTLDLPVDRLEPFSTMTVTVRGGAAATARAKATALYYEYGYGTASAADRLHLAATPGAPRPAEPRIVRDTIALLSRYQNGDGGWGWWENSPSDPRITARVLHALTALKKSPNILPSGVPFPDTLLQRAEAGAIHLYKETSLWEERAFLVAALIAANVKHQPLLDEVQERGGGTLSLQAHLLLAETAYAVGYREKQDAFLKSVKKYIAEGAESAYFPAGERPGWRNTTLTTTAQALETLITLRAEKEIQAKLARWLLMPAEDDAVFYPTMQEQSAAARALLRYARSLGRTNDTPIRESDLTLTVNGTTVPWNPRLAGSENFTPVTANIPRSLLKDGGNSIVLRRTESAGNDLFLSAEATLYRPQEQEIAAEMRVLRRIETQTAFGTWTEVKTDTRIPPGVPVRVTVVVWPNETADALRVIEPLPSGFEFVESDQSYFSRDEVRDGAIIHYLRVDGATPVTFRYYLRAESEGKLSALPATGELLRRPVIRGGSSTQTLNVEAGKEQE